MAQSRLIITPKTRIGELLAAYPELEDTLIELSPAFKKLKNPVLRKTIGKVTTLQQAAIVGHISVNTIVNTLRMQIGQEETQFSENISEKFATKPAWINDSNIKLRIDAIPIINSGDNPMGLIFRSLTNMGKGEVLEFKTPFIPAPIIDKLKESNYKTFTLKISKEEFYNYILKTD